MLTTDIKIHSSNLLTLLLITILCASIIIILSLAIALAYKALLITITLCYGLHILWQDCLLKSKYSITSLFLNQEGWHIVTAHQIWQGQLSGDSTLTAMVSVLRFKVTGRKRKLPCVICCDSIDRDSYRQLLVLLRTTHAREAEQIRRKRSVMPGK